MKIQFLLFSDGASHKLLGVNPAIGLQRIGVDVRVFWVKYERGERVFWVKYERGEIFENPDYVFCLKPRDSDDLILTFKNKGSSICLIANDEILPKTRISVYDFVVSPSLFWLNSYDLDSYLIKEEIDFCQQKQHQDSFKLVTFGYKENLVNHLTQVLYEFLDLDLTIVSNFDDSYSLPEIFYKFKLKKLNVPNFTDSTFDEKLVKQFEEYDVGLVTQYENCGRTTNRIKTLVYCGLPVITNQKNCENLWFNKDKIKLHLVNTNEWKERVLELKDKKFRQDESIFNFNLVKKNFGVEQSAKSFLDAINLYEQEKKSHA
jgi:hypothetical protein